MREALLTSIDDFEIELKNCGLFEFKKSRWLQSEIDDCYKQLRELNETEKNRVA